MPSKNVHLQVVNDAIRTNKKLARLAGKLGTKKNPRGKVLVIYNQLRRDLKRILATDRSKALKTREINGVLAVATLALRQAISDVLGTAGELGIESSARQLSLYDLEAALLVGQVTSINAGVDAAMSTVTSQFDNILAQTAISADPAIIIGDTARKGILRSSPIVRNSFDISATLTGSLWIDMIVTVLGPEPEPQGFSKQAIATMDDRVTETCLEVHGQIRPFTEPYYLIGTPRFADFIDAPPFHNHCRTSSALYDPAFELGITELLEKSAKQLLDLREVGINPVISPANAFTPLVRGEVKRL